MMILLHLVMDIIISVHHVFRSLFSSKLMGVFRIKTFLPLFFMFGTERVVGGVGVKRL
jgi:hypothetical protein